MSKPASSPRGKEQIRFQSVASPQSEFTGQDDKDDGSDRNQAEGWLCKKGSSKKSSWKRRYFILRSPNLLYYSPRTKGSVKVDRSGKIRRVIRTDYSQKDLEWVLHEQELLEGLLLFCGDHPDGKLVQCYLEIMRFRAMSCSSAEHFNLARSIQERFVDAVGLDQTVVQRIAEKMTRGVEQKQIPSDTFDECLQDILPTIQSSVLPGFTDFIRESRKEDEIGSLSGKGEAKEKAKECPACLKKFGFTTFRYECCECKLSYCSDCSTKSGDRKTRLCDICSMNRQFSSSFLFSYASHSRKRPLYLIADSEQSMLSWILQLREARSRAQFNTGKKQSPVHFEGWLIQEDPANKTWKRRFFILHNDRLWCHEMELKGRLIVSSMSVHPAPSSKPSLPAQDGESGGFTSETRFSSRFILSNANKLVHLAADSPGDVEYWAESIVRANHMSFHNQSEQTYELLDQVMGLGEGDGDGAPTGQVTFVFTDIQNSTNLWEGAPDDMDESLGQHDAIMRECLAKYSGYEVKTEGDAFMVVFQRAIDAMHWCVAVQQRLLHNTWPKGLLETEWAVKEVDGEGKMIFSGLRVRMGIHCGECNARRNPLTRRMDYFGPVVNRCARISDSAHGGQIIASDEVFREIQGKYDESAVRVIHLGEYPYKGIAELVSVYQISSTQIGTRLFPRLRTENTANESSVRSSLDMQSSREAKGSLDMTIPTQQRGRLSVHVPSSLPPRPLPESTREED